MRNIILSIAVFIAACGGQQGGTDLHKLKAERDSLRDLYSEIASKLAELDAHIAQKDTTIKKRVALVSSKQLELQRFEHFFEVHGSVETKKNITVSATAAGIVEEVKVEVGQRVKFKQPLVILDSETLRKSIEEVKNGLELANDMYQRQKKLWDQKIGSEVQFLQAKSQKEGLEKKLVTLNSQLDAYTIKAPFDGIVDEVFPKYGEGTAPGMPAVRLVNLSDVYVKSDVSEDYVATVNKGTNVLVRFPNYNKEFAASVNRVANYINPKNRTFKIEVDLDNSSGILKPNLLAIVKVMDFAQDSAVVVPSRVIQQDASGNEFLYICNRNEGNIVAKKVIIEPGISYGDKTMVVAGLKGTEEIVMEGARSIRDGQEIQL